MKIIERIFQKPLGLTSFFILLLGSFLGTLLWMGGFSLIFWAWGQSQTESDSSQFLTIQKPVAALASVFRSSAEFTAAELASLQKVPGIQDWTPVRRNGFRAFAGLSFPGGSFGSELFLESVPRRFLDLDEEMDWSWSEGEDVPLLIGQEFINLYNFVFAPSQGFPPMTKEALSSVHFDLNLSGNNRFREIPGFILSTSERFQTILVPEEFLLWANDQFSRVETGSTRVILSVDPRTLDLEALSDLGFEVSKESTRLTRLYATVFSAGSFLGIFSLFLVFVIALFNNRSLEVSLLQQKQDIHLLLDLGTPLPVLWKALGLGTFIPQITGLVLGFLALTAIVITQELEPSLTKVFLPSALLAGVLSLLSYFFQGLNLWKKIRAPI